MLDDAHPLDDAEHITQTYERLAYAAQRAQDRPSYVA
jgi:hypothetical protein